MYVCIGLAWECAALLYVYHRESCFFYMFILLSNCYTHTDTHRYTHTITDIQSVQMWKVKLFMHQFIWSICNSLFTFLLYCILLFSSAVSFSLLLTRSVSCTYTAPTHHAYIYIYILPYFLYIYTIYMYVYLSVNLFIGFGVVNWLQIRVPNALNQPL